jgi:alpha-L-fucosidase
METCNRFSLASVPHVLRRPGRLGLIALAAIAFVSASAAAPAPSVPPYLEGYAALYQRSPHQAALHWFADARYGLMVHYCLASILDQGKEGYLAMKNADQTLFNRFTAAEFDAAKIADLAVGAGMKYVNFTTEHLGGMAMWDSAVSEFNSVRSPAHRDLTAELAQACARRKLGFFVYVPPDTSRTDGAFFAKNQRILTELLTRYGPIAGVWFDGVAGLHTHPERYTQTQELYALVRRLQPQCLVSWKSSADGTDFLAPEHTVDDLPYRYPRMPIEVCTTMQKCRRRDLGPDRTAWINNEATAHLSAEEVVMMVRELQLARATNILINLGLRGDGSIHPKDEKALRAAASELASVAAPRKRL